jgi:hypothetical protein
MAAGSAPARWGRRRQLGQSLQRHGHLWARELVVAMPALHPDPHHPAIDKTAEVGGGGGRVHTRPPGQLSSR